MSVFRSIYKYWVSILTAAVVVQIFFAGYGAFDTADKIDRRRDREREVVRGLVRPARRARVPDLPGHDRAPAPLVRRARQAANHSLRRGGGLLIVQILLAWTGASAPYIFGGLHPINAFIILGLLGSTAYLEWKGRMDRAEPAMAAPAA